MIFKAENIQYTRVSPPTIEIPGMPEDLSDATYHLRASRTLTAMRERDLDVLVIYADREHGANFGYLTGFEPRFEEACLVLHSDGKAYVLLGNECLKMHAYSRLPVCPVHIPCFSLPNQPMLGEKPVEEGLREAGIRPGMRCGIIGWKMFTTTGDNQQLFDVPHFIVEAIRTAVLPGGTIQNSAELMIDPASGLRTIVTAAEIAEFEFASSTAAFCVWRVLERLKPGMTERELASDLSIYGMPLSCYSMCATGERFSNAVVYPRNKKVAIGDKFTVSMGLRGGLTCRAGYVAAAADDLPQQSNDWLERAVKSYFAASATWYSTIGIGVTGAEIYDSVDASYPKAEYGWKLNPGHLTATEEWLCSPVSKGSRAVLKSGMMLQMDIIPSIPGLSGVNAEDGVLLADDELRNEISAHYPELFARFARRRSYITDILGIPLRPEVMPMTDTVGYLRPLMLNRECALRLRY